MGGVSFCFPAFLGFDCFFQFSMSDGQWLSRYGENSEVPEERTNLVHPRQEGI